MSDLFSPGRIAAADQLLSLLTRPMGGKRHHSTFDEANDENAPPPQSAGKSKLFHEPLSSTHKKASSSASKTAHRTPLQARSTNQLRLTAEQEQSVVVARLVPVRFGGTEDVPVVTVAARKMSTRHERHRISFSDSPAVTASSKAQTTEAIVISRCTLHAVAAGDDEYDNGDDDDGGDGDYGDADHECASTPPDTFLALHERGASTALPKFGRHASMESLSAAVAAMVQAEAAAATGAANQGAASSHDPAVSRGVSDLSMVTAPQSPALSSPSALNSSSPSMSAPPLSSPSSSATPSSDSTVAVFPLAEHAARAAAAAAAAADDDDGTSDDDVYMCDSSAALSSHSAGGMFRLTLRGGCTVSFQRGDTATLIPDALVSQHRDRGNSYNTNDSNIANACCAALVAPHASAFAALERRCHAVTVLPCAQALGGDSSSVPLLQMTFA